VIVQAHVRGVTPRLAFLLTPIAWFLLAVVFAGLGLGISAMVFVARYLRVLRGGGLHICVCWAVLGG
jgi:hypothetical protein